MKNYLEKLSSSTLTYRIKFIKISTQPYDKVIYLKAAVGYLYDEKMAQNLVTTQGFLPIYF